MNKYEGILKIFISKNDKKIYNICYSDNKEKSKTRELKDLDLSACKDNDSCTIEMENNNIINCWVNGKKIASGKDANMTSKSQKSSTSQNDDKVIMGFGPYNFSSYEPDLILPPFKDEERKWSGKIICELSTLTPLLVAGEHEKKDDGSSICKFMQLEDKNVIPGSSLKGMLRSVIEILSYSGLRPMNKKKLFWRDLTNKNNYMAVFGDKLLGGFLRQHGADYDIVEVTVEKNPPKNTAYIQVKTGKKIGGDKKPNIYYFHKPRESDRVIAIDREVVNRFQDQLTPGQKKRHPKNEREAQMCGKTELPGLPVFFYRDGNGHVRELGFCRYFRLQYKYSPYELAWPDEEKRNVEDIAQTLFGYVGEGGKDGKKSLAGRIAVEPLLLQGKAYGPKDGLELVLGGPKPSCVPFYLQQDLDKIKTTQKADKNKLKDMINYNDKDAKLRGRKLYWHHEPDMEYLLTKLKPVNKNVAAYLHALDKDVHGFFNIHINNLTDSELGCLLEAIELKKESAHKLGMGKALGFGSVRLKIAHMNVEDVRKKYSSLTARLAQAESPEMPLEEREKLRENFRKRIFEMVQAQDAAGNAANYYQLQPIKDLFIILNWQRQPLPGKVEYMTLNEYMQNAVLPKPGEVKKHNIDNEK